MKIAIFTDTYLPEKNGVVISINNFSEILAKRGHEILIIAPKYKGYADEKKTGITVVRYPAFSFTSNKATKVAFPKTIDLVKKLRNFKPDLIHIQTPASLGIVGIIMAKLLKVPNIQTYHTYLPELAVYFDVAKVFGLEKIPDAINSSRLTKRIMDSDFYELLTRAGKKETLSEFIGFKPKKKKPNYEPTERVLWAYTRWVYNRANLVLTPSHILAKKLKAHGVKPVVDAQTNGIWADSFAKKTNYKLQNKLIYLGRLGHEKRVDVVVKAFAVANKSFPKLKLYLYGPGPATDELKKLAGKLGVFNSIVFKGAYQIERMKPELKKFDIFLTASPMETQGLVILEAMAAGLPVIGANKLAIPEIVKSGKNGYVVPAESYEIMGRKIIKLVEDDGLRQKMGEAALKIVEAHNMPKAVELLEKHYQSVLKT